MTIIPLAVAITAELALVAIGAGLVARGRWRLSYFFSLYLATALLSNVLATWWPTRFWNWPFWAAKESAYPALKVGIGLEVAWRTFRRFPVARGAGGKCALVVLALTLLSVMASPTLTSDHAFYAWACHELCPRVTTGAIWLMAATLVLVLWYRLPMHPFHISLITSIGIYSMFLSVLNASTATYGYLGLRYVYFFDFPIYLLLVVWWTYVAWRADSSLTLAHEEVLRQLQTRMVLCG